MSFLCHPVEEKISWLNVKLLCMLIWLYALLWALLPILGWGRYGPEPFGLSCSLAWGNMKEEGFSFVISLFIFNLAVPTVVIVSCYFGIAIKLYVTYKKSGDTSKRMPNIVKLHQRLLTVSGKLSKCEINESCKPPLESVWPGSQKQFIAVILVSVKNLIKKSQTNICYLYSPSTST